MPIDPKTEEEAREAGFERLPDLTVHMHIDKEDRHAADLFDKLKSAAPDCSVLPPGAKCLETGCIDGYKIVLFCNNSRGCTVRYKVPC